MENLSDVMGNLWDFRLFWKFTGKFPLTWTSCVVTLYSKGVNVHEAFQTVTLV